MIKSKLYDALCKFFRGKKWSRNRESIWMTGGIGHCIFKQVRQSNLFTKRSPFIYLKEDNSGREKGQCRGPKLWILLAYSKDNKKGKRVMVEARTDNIRRRQKGNTDGSAVKNLPANADVSSIPGSGRSSREGNGSPLLGNPMDRRAWQATVHVAAHSWTRLSD